LIKIKPLVKPYSPYDAFWDTLMLATPFIGIAITYWIFNKVNPDSMMKRITSNKKSMKIESTKDIKVRFKDVAGMENAKK
jgi:ATP-dependent Zn protease